MKIASDHHLFQNLSEDEPQNTPWCAHACATFMMMTIAELCFIFEQVPAAKVSRTIFRREFSAPESKGNISHGKRPRVLQLLSPWF